MKKTIKYKGTDILVEVSKVALPGVEAEAESPAGKIFTNSDTHFVYGADNENDSAAVERATEVIKEDIDAGFEDCVNPECEICHPPKDEEIGT